MIGKLFSAGLIATLGACLAAGCNAPVDKPPPSPQAATTTAGAPPV
jgi:hypothetical protein